MDQGSSGFDDLIINASRWTTEDEVNPFADLQGSLLDGGVADAAPDLAQPWSEAESQSTHQDQSFYANTSINSERQDFVDQRSPQQQSNNTNNEVDNVSVSPTNTTTLNLGDGLDHKPNVNVSPTSPQDSGLSSSGQHGHQEQQYVQKQPPSSSVISSPEQTRALSPTMSTSPPNAAGIGGVGPSPPPTNNQGQQHQVQLPSQQQYQQQQLLLKQQQERLAQLNIQQQQSQQSSTTEASSSSSSSQQQQPSYRDQQQPQPRPSGGKPTFVISVGDPQKVGSEITGSAHTVYTVKTRTNAPSFHKPEFSVLRRYRDFLWLYDILTANNPGVIVPQPPEKHALGRFDEDFVEQRRISLQDCLQRIVNHPLLYSDPDLKSFLESDSFNINVKSRKPENVVEKSGLFSTLGSTFSGNRFVEPDEYFENKKHSIDALEPQLKTLHTTLTNVAKTRHVLASSAKELSGVIISLTSCDLSRSTRDALTGLSNLQKHLADNLAAEAKDQELHIIATVHSYMRLISSIRITFASREKAWINYQKADNQVKIATSAHEKAKRQGRTHAELMKQSLAEITEAERKCDDCRREFADMSNLIKSELARFDMEKVQDMKNDLVRMVQGLASCQKQIVQGWETFNNVAHKAIQANKEEQQEKLQQQQQQQQQDHNQGQTQGQTQGKEQEQEQHQPKQEQDQVSTASPTA